MAKALWTCSKNLMRKLLSLHPTGLLQSVVLALSLWLLGVAGGWAQTELIERVEFAPGPGAALAERTRTWAGGVRAAARGRVWCVLGGGRGCL